MLPNESYVLKLLYLLHINTGGRGFHQICLSNYKIFEQVYLLTLKKSALKSKIFRRRMFTALNII